jgi:large subunit ribosomal protein L9
VILTEDVSGVGSKGEIKQVPVGYWRNFLLPNGRANIATSNVLE